MEKRGAGARKWARRIGFIGVIVLQLAFVVRAYSAPHKEFGFQMFPEASYWQADIVRVTDDGRRIPISESWFGYEWGQLVRGRKLSSPWLRQQADAGIENQMAFLSEALAWVAANTPRDGETLYYEASVTTWRNLGGPETRTLRSPTRELP